jgi:hypothetical protein
MLNTIHLQMILYKTLSDGGGHMKRLSAASCLLAATLLVSGVATGKNKEPAPCVVYFAVVENDEVTVRLSMAGLNKPQRSWYDKHGDRDRFAGICYAPKVSDVPADAPLYAIVWGEHLVSEPYTWTSESTREVTGTATDDSGNIGTVTMSSP